MLFLAFPSRIHVLSASYSLDTITTGATDSIGLQNDRVGGRPIEIEITIF